MGKLRAFAAGALLWSIPATAANSPEPAEIHADLIHSDEPLWTSADQLWPMHFSDSDSWGCASQFAVGDWQGAEGSDHSETWLRLQNYGVFHCAYIVKRASDRAYLDNAQSSYGWLVRVGKVDVRGAKRELWVFQSGSKPGSSYSFFAVERSKGIIKAAEELQRKCPAGHMRGGATIDVWGTQYCAVNSRAELVSLARRMAKLKPLFILEFVGEVPQKTEGKP